MSVFSINIPLSLRPDPDPPPCTVLCCSSVSSNTEMPLIVPLSAIPWNSKAMDSFRPTIILEKALSKILMISSTESCSPGAAWPRRKKPISRSIDCRNNGAAGWGGVGNGSIVTESPVTERPIHWRWREDAAIWPGCTFPVSSCLMWFIACQLWKYTTVKRARGVLDCTRELSFDKDMLTMSKVRRIADQAVCERKGLARRADYSKGRPIILLYQTAGF